jgi:Tfp pilus assembly protein PilF
VAGGSLEFPQMNSVYCPTEQKSILKQAWTDLVAMANSCLLKNKLNMAEEIALELSNNTSHAPWGPYYLALVAEKNGNLKKAIWMSELALKRAPDVGILNFNKGRLLWKNADFSESVEYLEKSISLKINIYEAYYLLGAIYLRDQDLKKAKNYLNGSLNLNTNHFDTLVSLAKVHHLEGDLSNEMLYLERANRVKSNNEWVKKRLSILISQNSKREPAKIVEKQERGQP